MKGESFRHDKRQLPMKNVLRLQHVGAVKLSRNGISRKAQCNSKKQHDRFDSGVYQDTSIDDNVDDEEEYYDQLDDY
ncbi:hypothetical protein GJ496_010083 [Pomphorhynchus laevis]|nr:hypothetical protein GJ496_010083 [Pomphorhynchus laevis]